MRADNARDSVHTEFRIHGILSTRDSVHTEQYTGFRLYGAIHGIPFIRSNTRDSVHTGPRVSSESPVHPALPGWRQLRSIRNSVHHRNYGMAITHGRHSKRHCTVSVTAPLDATAAVVVADRVQQVYRTGSPDARRQCTGVCSYTGWRYFTGRHSQRHRHPPRHSRRRGRQARRSPSTPRRAPSAPRRPRRPPWFAPPPAAPPNPSRPRLTGGA
jgi:hypothetical protein